MTKIRTFAEVNQAIVEACREQPTKQITITMKAAVSHIRLNRAVKEGVIKLVEKVYGVNGAGRMRPVKLYSPVKDYIRRI